MQPEFQSEPPTELAAEPTSGSTRSMRGRKWLIVGAAAVGAAIGGAGIAGAVTNNLSRIPARRSSASRPTRPVRRMKRPSRRRTAPG